MFAFIDIAVPASPIVNMRIRESGIQFDAASPTSKCPSTATPTNNPITRNDPSGHCGVDILADVVFLAIDVGSLVFGPEKEREGNWLALGADAAGAAIPCATGLGVIAPAGIKTVGTGGKILEGANAVRSAAVKFGVDFEKLKMYVHREVKPNWGLGPADNVRFLPNGTSFRRSATTFSETSTTYWSERMAEEVVEPRSQVEAALVVLSETLSAADLRVMIGVEPDHSWEAGDPIGRSGRARQRFSGWSIREGPSEEPAESHISAILDRVYSVQGKVARAGGDPRIHSVALWVWSQGRTFGVDLPPARMQDIAALRASLKIDVYDIDADGVDTRATLNGNGRHSESA